jgi:hypothetical protein
MPSPSIPNFNGQIKTPWRWYDSAAWLNGNQRQCADLWDWDSCSFALIWPGDSLPPFQFVRPSSMDLVTSWKLYDGPGDDAAMVLDLADQIINLTYFQASGVDYITYNEQVFGDSAIDSGRYWARIVSGGVTYYSEPVTVVCRTYLPNSLTVDPFAAGLYSSQANPSGLWHVQFGDGRTLIGSTLVAGTPTDPAFAVEGALVANFGDNLLYTYSGGSWASSTPGTSTSWYDSKSGNWYRFNAGAWQGLATDPMTVDGDGMCFTGTGQTPEFRRMNFTPQDHISACSESVMQFTLTVTGRTTGELNVHVGELGFQSVMAIIEEDGTTTFTFFVGADTLLTVFPSGGFDGCLTGLTIGCAATVNECFYKLDWSNCGNVGNTYAAGGFVQAMFLEQSIYPIVPEVNTVIEQKTKADGSRIDVSKRKETTWTLKLGLRPWYIADALSDLPLYDTVRLTAVGLSPDVMTNVRVAVDWQEDFGECLAEVTITFQLESATVACCDDFDPPCRESCVSAAGFDDGTLANDDYYLFRNQPRFAYYTGDAFQPYTTCESGLAQIVRGEGSPYHVYFDLNTLGWSSVALIAYEAPTEEVDGDCVQSVAAVVMPGHVGVLQRSSDGTTWEDTDIELSADDWLVGVDITRPNATNEYYRIKVMVGECIIGYGSKVFFNCP